MVLLDCINLLRNNQEFDDDEFEGTLEYKAAIMLSWLNHITFKNGTIPMVNDSSAAIGPTTDSLNSYAKALNIKPYINPNYAIPVIECENLTSAIEILSYSLMLVI